MSDSRRVYRAINQAIKQLYPQEPRGNLARHLDTLTGMVTGLILGRSCQLPKIASKLPGMVHPESRVKQMSRWVQNESITVERYFLPFVQPLLANLAAVRPLMFILDSSRIARGCVTLMASLIYGRRAIPIVWIVIEGAGGHFSTATQVALLRTLKTLVPATASVTVLGDGEFDSPALQAEAQASGWAYVCRTAPNIQIRQDGAWLSLAELNVARGRRCGCKGVFFTLEAYGPVMVIAWWDAAYDEPIYLVSNLHNVQRACAWYRKRAQVETFFADQKSRGFQLHKSHLQEADRVRRLMLATCFAYLWVIFLGTVAQQDGWTPKIHRRHRCDLSLFQLGLRLLDHFLNHDLSLPHALTLAPESVR